MIFNNCNFVDCQTDIAATSLDSCKGVKGLTNVRIVGNQIITEDGGKDEKKERPENGQDGQKRQIPPLPQTPTPPPPLMGARVFKN